MGVLREDMCAKDRLSRRSHSCGSTAKAVLGETAPLGGEAELCNGKEIMFDTQTSWVHISNVPLAVRSWTSYLTSPPFLSCY